MKIETNEARIQDDKTSAPMARSDRPLCEGVCWSKRISETRWAREGPRNKMTMTERKVIGR
jgi:hypothetical protein